MGALRRTSSFSTKGTAEPYSAESALKALRAVGTQYQKDKKITRSAPKATSFRDIGFDICPVGEGTIDVATGREQMLGRVLDLPRDPPSLGSLRFSINVNGTVAAINAQRVLDRLLLQIPEYKKKRGRPNNLAEYHAVFQAAHFFAKYSTAALTEYPGGTFTEFCELFYEKVTGAAVEPGDLESQIKKVVRDFNRSKGF
jgi:hypothetical protein